jgi:hypothetical protein
MPKYVLLSNHGNVSNINEKNRTMHGGASWSSLFDLFLGTSASEGSSSASEGLSSAPKPSEMNRDRDDSNPDTPVLKMLKLKSLFKSREKKLQEAKYLLEKLKRKKTLEKRNRDMIDRRNKLFEELSKKQCVVRLKDSEDINKYEKDPTEKSAEIKILCNKLLLLK